MRPSLALLLLISAGVGAGQALPNAQEIVRRSVERDFFNSEQARNYTFMREVDERHLDSGGNVKTAKSETAEVLILFGEPHERTIRRNGKPLAPDEERKQEEKLNRLIERRKKETEKQRTKRLAKSEKRRWKSREFLQSIPEAFHFRLVGDDVVSGREAWVVGGTPNPAFRSHDARTRRLRNFRGRIWIAKEGYECVKLEAKTTGNIAFSGVIARLDTGAIMECEQERINDEIWLPSRVHVKFDARVALVKRLRRIIDIRFFDYRKFQSDSRIVSTSSVMEQ